MQDIYDSELKESRSLLIQIEMFEDDLFWAVRALHHYIMLHLGLERIENRNDKEL